MRTVIGGVVHESNTFATDVLGPTRLADFEISAGQELAGRYAGTNTCLGGYLTASADARVPVLPALYARAEPSGAIDWPAYRAIEARFCGLLEPADVLLLDLHGAGVIGAGTSLELRLLRAIRTITGPAPTIAVAMDLHGNLPDELPSLADVIVGCHEYPHTDLAERAQRAAWIARNFASPVSRLLRLPMVLPPSPTGTGPAAELRELVKEAEREPGVLACTVFHGFPYADVSQAGTSIVTVTNGATWIADEVNSRLAAWLWRERDRFLCAQIEPAHAVAWPGAGGPVVIGDAGDNPGGGGCGDGTYLLRSVLDSGVRACFATLCDPDAVTMATRAGLGAVIALDLGGRHGPFSGPPLPVTATVRALTDGKAIRQSVRGGTLADFGPSARLAIGNADVIVATNRLQVFDPGPLLLHGVVPGQYDLIAVKSAHHFRSGFAGIGSDFITADAPGLTTRQIESLPFSGPAAALWPANPGARYHQVLSLAGAVSASPGEGAWT
jgi:microcystin degradation protein MlrC